MKVMGLGWVREKLAALKAKAKDEVKHKEKEKAPPLPRIHRFTPWWKHNMVHPTGSCEAGGRTLNPYAADAARKQLAEQRKALQTKVDNGTATRRERWMLNHMQS